MYPYISICTCILLRVRTCHMKHARPCMYVCMCSCLRCCCFFCFGGKGPPSEVKEGNLLGSPPTTQLGPYTKTLLLDSDSLPTCPVTGFGHSADLSSHPFRHSLGSQGEEGGKLKLPKPKWRREMHAIHISWYSYEPHVYLPTGLPKWLQSHFPNPLLYIRTSIYRQLLSSPVYQHPHI